jgi:hypothetical protein
MKVYKYSPTNEKVYGPQKVKPSKSKRLKIVSNRANVRALKNRLQGT